jgi:hypothetical protein
MFDQFVAHMLFQVSAFGAQTTDPVNSAYHQVEAIRVIEYRYIKGSRGCAFLLVATYVQVVMIGSTVGETVDQPRVTMKGKDGTDKNHLITLSFGRRLILRKSSVNIRATTTSLGLILVGRALPQ